MPFGFTNAPATFQRLMDIVLAGFKLQYCLVYLDDIIFYSSTFEQHLYDLRKVFLALVDAKLKFLGHLVTPEGIKLDPDLISTITEFAVPTNIKAVQAFLGLTNYYRRFIQNYAKIAEPLLKLLRSTQSKTHRSPLSWNDDCTTALEWLKNAREPTGHQARWAMKLSPYNIVIQHRPGTNNPNGDFMSHYPLDTNNSNLTELNSIESSINILEGTNILDQIRSE
ncbi:unnamed protein product [Rotaria sp. Silwood1]|nr:unnamed protein product [Rotaria sp. Silwood1]